MALAPLRRLLTGLDTVQVAYYLRPGFNSAFSYEQLLLAKERLRANGAREGKPVEIGGLRLLLQPYGSWSGYPLVLKHSQFTIECGENNTPGFFVTFRSEALWQLGARALRRRSSVRGSGARRVRPRRCHRVVCRPLLC